MSRAHHRRRPPRRLSQWRPELELLLNIRRSLDEDHPFSLLVIASQLMEVSTPRPIAQFTGQAPMVSQDDLFRSIRETDRRETTAMLHALSTLLPDDMNREEVRSELRGRSHYLPDWITELDEASVTAVAEMTHILRDGDNVMVEIRWPSGRRMTSIVYIDHNAGTVVKDAFPVPEPLNRLAVDIAQSSDPLVTIGDLDPAEARSRIVDAIKDGKRLIPPFESETWPQCRPIIEWVIRMLPTGGTGYERPEWSAEQRAALGDRFLASPFAAGLVTETNHRDLVDDLLWFGSDYGARDPLHWSPVPVEMILADWLPRKIIAPVVELRGFPDVLRAFVRFAHADRGIPIKLTEETLNAVDLWEPEFQAAINDPDRPIGTWALVEATRGLLGLDDGSHREYMLDLLADQVGGHEQLDQLDSLPIPDESLDWTGMPDDIHERVTEVLELADRCCDEVLDVEYRTIVRRLLARAATGDPAVFRRKARTDYAAAALVWAAGRSSDLFRTMTVKSLMGWFGFSHWSPSQRAETLIRAAGIRTTDAEYMFRAELGDPDLLHSEKRRHLIEARDRYRENR